MEQKKIVFIGFGSIIIPDPEEMTRVVTEAVERSGVFAIIAKGWSDRAASSKDDDTTIDTSQDKEQQERKESMMLKRPYIFNIKSIPHDWLFPRIDAAVHHGGAGTTGASLRGKRFSSLTRLYLGTDLKAIMNDSWITNYH